MIPTHQSSGSTKALLTRDAGVHALSITSPPLHLNHPATCHIQASSVTVNMRGEAHSSAQSKLCASAHQGPPETCLTYFG